MYFDENNPNGLAKSQLLLYDESKYDKNVNIENTLKTRDDSDVGFFVEVDLKNPNAKRKKNYTFFILTRNKS